MSDINTALVDRLKALDPNRPIREADIPLFKDLVGGREQCRRNCQAKRLSRPLRWQASNSATCSYRNAAWLEIVACDVDHLTSG